MPAPGYPSGYRLVELAYAQASYDERHGVKPGRGTTANSPPR